MLIKKIVVFFLVLLFFLSLIFYLYTNNLNKNTENNSKVSDDLVYSSNIIENVRYQSSDAKGNKYIINALTGEIDYSNPNIIFLTAVEGNIILNTSEIINIKSDFGKYNSENLDTIFSKNVIIRYLDNKITGEYLDFSMDRSTMIVSQNVIYTNLENILKADVVEMDIKTKDTKIFMFEEGKKVNIRNKN